MFRGIRHPSPVGHRSLRPIARACCVGAGRIRCTSPSPFFASPVHLFYSFRALVLTVEMLAGKVTLEEASRDKINSRIPAFELEFKFDPWKFTSQESP